MCRSIVDEDYGIKYYYGVEVIIDIVFEWKNWLKDLFFLSFVLYFFFIIYYYCFMGGRDV